VKTYVGIDVSKLTLDVAALLGSGEIKRNQFENDALGHEKLNIWLRTLEQSHVILEATGSYHQNLVVWLQSQAQAVSVINPRQSHDYAKSLNRRNKQMPQMLCY
jgi:transposase